MKIIATTPGRRTLQVRGVTDGPVEFDAAGEAEVDPEIGRVLIATYPGRLREARPAKARTTRGAEQADAADTTTEGEAPDTQETD